MAEDRNLFARRPGERFVDFIERIGDAYGLVFLGVISSYVATSLIPGTGWPAVAPVAIGSVTAVIALGTSGIHPDRAKVAAFLALAAIAAAVAAAAADRHVFLGAAYVLESLLLLVGALSVLRRVLLSSQVSASAILGAISVYTLIGLLFTFVYAAIARLQGDPFFEGVLHTDARDVVFFSYTTLTTTGYGNLVPDGQPGQMVAGLEMLTGQVFLVTLVAGLVSLWRPGQRLTKRRARG